jgi:hypothetical protein
VEAETAARLGRKARENGIAIVDFPLDGVADLDRSSIRDGARHKNGNVIEVMSFPGG